jgi:hypothetical protein
MPLGEGTLELRKEEELVGACVHTGLNLLSNLPILVERFLGECMVC